jgi:hypothetical protein
MLLLYTSTISHHIPLRFVVDCSAINITQQLQFAVNRGNPPVSNPVTSLWGCWIRTFKGEVSVDESVFTV